MTCPEDLPNDLWDLAYHTAKSWYHEEWDESQYIQWQLVEYIARALFWVREHPYG
jgi:hypothetical protein